MLVKSIIQVCWCKKNIIQQNSV